MGAKTRGKRLQVGNSTQNKSLKKVAIRNVNAIIDITFGRSKLLRYS